MATIANENRPDMIVEETQFNAFVGTPRRISWGAVTAGVLLAIIIQIALNVLGLAIGAAALDPESATNAIGPTFSTGAVVWIGVSTLLSLFAGGYVAAHLSGNPDKFDATIHGLLTWALATLLSLILMWSTASSIVAGVSSLVVDGISLIGASVQDVAPEVANAIDAQDTLLEAIRDEAGTVGVDEEAPTNAQVVVAVTNLLRSDAETPEAEEARSVAVNVLTAQTNMTQAEAQQQIDAWEQEYRQAVTDAQVLAEQTADDLADATAVTGGIVFLMLVLGAFAGGGGGFAGRPFKDLQDEELQPVAT